MPKEHQYYVALQVFLILTKTSMDQKSPAVIFILFAEDFLRRNCLLRKSRV